MIVNKILLTTSHRPSRRVRTFLKELSSVIPNSIRVNRGKKTLEDLFLYALASRVDRIVIVNCVKGNPSSILVYNVDLDSKVMKRRYLIKILGVKLWREVENNIKIYDPKSICVDVSEIEDDESLRLCDIIRDILHAKLVTDEEMIRDFDVKVEIYRRNMKFTIRFIHPQTNRIGGPVIRVGRAIVYEES